MQHKPAQTRAPIHPLLASRWSPRAFDESRQVDKEARIAIAEAARWAPSCFGAEPWRFVFFDRYTNPAAFARALECLAEGNRQWAKRAPLLVLVCAEKIFAHNGEANRHASYDAGAAAFSLVLEAEHRGLRCHQMAGFDADAARAAFSVPDSCECLAMIAIGEQAGAERLDENMREREAADRSRTAPEDRVFEGEWGNALY